MADALAWTLAWASIGAAVAWLVLDWWRTRGSEQRQRQQGHEAVKACLDEDLSALDEDLWRLGRDLADAEYDGDARRDYERAVAINDAARRATDQLSSVNLADAITDALAEARYAMTCARSRLDAESVPERRLPCFFNPRHGPSVADVRWHDAPGEPLDVPACAAHAPRIATAEEPDSLHIWTGRQRVPYWQATVAFYAYATGYFSGDWAGSKDGAQAAIQAGLLGDILGADATFWGLTGGDGGGGGC
jgi:hypothetical protein